MQMLPDVTYGDAIMRETGDVHHKYNHLLNIKFYPP